jgi:hypothetical protein
MRTIQYNYIMYYNQMHFPFTNTTPNPHLFEHSEEDPDNFYLTKVLEGHTRGEEVVRDKSKEAVKDRVRIK